MPGRGWEVFLRVGCEELLYRSGRRGRSRRQGRGGREDWRRNRAAPVEEGFLQRRDLLAERVVLGLCRPQFGAYDGEEPISLGNVRFECRYVLYVLVKNDVLKVIERNAPLRRTLKFLALILFRNCLFSLELIFLYSSGLGLQSSGISDTSRF
jgi:hypothetical protein